MCKIKNSQEKEILVKMNQSSCIADEKWYAFYTNSRAEKKVYQRLIQKNIQAFLPLVTVQRQWSDRVKFVSIPLINSYVFVKTTEKLFPELLKTQGITAILKYLGKPAVIKESEIENLKIVAESGEPFEVISKEEMEADEIVQVTKGPLKGLFGRYLNKAGKHRVVIYVDMLQLGIEVTLPIVAITKMTT